MKRFLIATTALATLFTGSVASAQSHYDRQSQYQRDGRYNDRADRRDDRRDYRNDRRNDRGYSNNRRYARGDRYRGDGAYVRDYRRYGYRAPPRGYGYYRTNNGDVLLAAIATGLITSVIVGNNNGYRR